MSLLSVANPLVCARSLEEARQLFVQSAPVSGKRDAYLAQWRVFSAQEIESASDMFSIRQAYFRTHGDTPEKENALQKFLHALESELDAATTTDRIAFVAGFAPLCSKPRARALEMLSRLN